jgi:LPXTG-motif cell wall-anchored protein
MMKRGD